MKSIRELLLFDPHIRDELINKVYDILLAKEQKEELELDYYL